MVRSGGCWPCGSHSNDSTVAPQWEKLLSCSNRLVWQLEDRLEPNSVGVLSQWCVGMNCDWPLGGSTDIWDQASPSRLFRGTPGSEYSSGRNRHELNRTGVLFRTAAGLVSVVPRRMRPPKALIGVRRQLIRLSTSHRTRYLEVDRCQGLLLHLVS